jgi:hypothetical protein
MASASQDYNKHNLGIFSHVDESDPERNYIPGKCFLRANDVLTRNSIVLLIAFPFKGNIKPIIDEDLFRIYSGVIVTTKKEFEHNKLFCKNIMYLTIKLDERVFDPLSYKYGKEININLEAYYDPNYRDKSKRGDEIIYQQLNIRCVDSGCIPEYTVLKKSKNPNNPIFLAANSVTKPKSYEDIYTLYIPPRLTEEERFLKEERHRIRDGKLDGDDIVEEDSVELDRIIQHAIRLRQEAFSSNERRKSRAKFQQRQQFSREGTSTYQNRSSDYRPKR